MVVVAAVDRTDRARAVVAEAERLAEAFGEPMHVVHALTESEFVDLEMTAMDESGRALSMDEVTEFARDVAERASEGIGGAHEAVGLVGNPTDEIVGYAEAVDARFIVVGPRRRSPTGKAVFGSVVQSIILHADRPVVSAVETGE